MLAKAADLNLVSPTMAISGVVRFGLGLFGFWVFCLFGWVGFGGFFLRSLILFPCHKTKQKVTPSLSHVKHKLHIESEYPELEGTQDHPVQLLTPARATWKLNRRFKCCPSAS